LRKTVECTLTGNEDLRYYSISFPGGDHPNRQDDADIHQATRPSRKIQNGNVTMPDRLGGRSRPLFVTPANYYTYVD